MVKIIYNLFSRNPNSNVATHWLQTIVNGFKAISKTNCVIRVDADKHSNWSSYKERDTSVCWSAYKVRNTSNKMKAICYNKDGSIFIEIYELPLPDGTQPLKPVFTDFIAHGRFNNNPEGNKEDSQFLANYLEADNAYLRNEQSRICLTPDKASLVPKAVFLGGLLIDYDYDPTVNETVVTLVDPNNQFNNPVKFKYILNGALKTNEVGKEKALVGKYILINAVDDYLYMSKAIVDMYYKFI